MGDLGERSLDVGQRQDREAAQPTSVDAHARRDLLVGDASQLDRAAAVGRRRARRAGGDHRGIDPVPVHDLHQLLERGRRQRRARAVGKRRQGGSVGVGNDVGVEVDPRHDCCAYSTIATTRAGAALAPTIRSGKHATVNPVGGSAERLNRRSICE